ncbi:PREDICTED: zinc metalloproteinase nas-13-like [Dufourea novaeangliae]|uniref:Metalloendopeptidase n=1 Tax=Dufourea novaeangliae TaxID=178035 RepID=A0A154PFH6_DUFNO|nr:PREDICTED: zinc metalloproteinase nas-13-like [Dufourea novaeangliae]KZC10613.1 Zinc metalloproteinase nas-13 [Dufourea novaeangliae]
MGRFFSIVCALVLLTSATGWPFQRRDILDNSVDSPDSVIAHLQHFGEILYRFPDNATGAAVANWHEGWDTNPEELGSYAEGDILFPAHLEKNGLKAESARWPRGVVPYMISPYFNEKQRKLIFEAIDDYHRYTCIKFKPYTGEENDYIRITAGETGCWSSVGRVGGRQDVNLQVPGCVVKKGTVIHELMHVIGFLHEQSRYERDEFVRIQWNNILNGHAGNFEKASRETTDAFGVGYDYGSVMHYSAGAFSRNGQPTIIPKEQKLAGFLCFMSDIFQGSSTVQLGQREGFSKRDIQKIRKMYRCSKRRRSNPY